ncbi:MAG: PqqD family protein [Clostridia bacterium]|nr:PqqD family protein [Clostridia bacterium]
MKINENFLLREVAGNRVVMPVGEAAERFNGMIKLNGSGAYLFEKIQTGAADEEGLVAAMLADYDVDEETARRDIGNFITTLRKMGIIEE